MIIQQDIKRDYKVRTIATETVVELFMANRKRQGELTPKEAAHLNNVIKLSEYVNTLLKNDHILHLSDDEELAEIIGCSKHAAKRAKNKMRKLGLIYVPEWARQKKEGDHPIWLVWFKLTNIVETAKTVSKKARKKNFVQLYYTLKEKAKKNVREMFEYHEKETGETVSIHIRDYMKLVNQEFTDILNNRGLTRADLHI